jgi:chromosome segregation ATPase
MKSNSAPKNNGKKKVSEFQQLKLLFTKETSLNKERFKQIDKHFEQVDKHFEQVDKRFEQVDKRFEQVDRRFDSIDRKLDTHERRLDEHDNKFAQNHNELLNYLDKIFGAIQELRTENKASTFLYDKHSEKINDHEERISVLEEKII